MPDFDRLSERQIEALSAVAFGGEGASFHPRTLESLVRLGLIEPVQMAERSAEFGGGTFLWTTYTMSLPVHIAFCEWCSVHCG
jgi:hypothetical protein